MFADVEVKQNRDDAQSSTVVDSNTTLTVPTVDDDMVACAMLDLRPISLSNLDDYKNRVYFKSEVAVRGKDYGWVMWNGLSTAATFANNKWQGDANIPYNLVLFKKEGGKWKVDKGYGWDQYHQDNISHSHFHIITPEGEWLNRRYDAKDEFERRSWTGIARVDEKEGKDILSSMEMWMDDKKYAEFFGNDGNFSDATAGFRDVRWVYVDGQGWKRLSASKNLNEALKNWYKPFKEKKIKWSSLRDACNEWSGIRGAGETNQTMIDICYTK